MAFRDQEHCAVRGCLKPCGGWATLCEEHRVPGIAVTGERGTCVITAWYAEHEGRRGIVLLNDFALGDLFGSAEAFKARLIRQGFAGIGVLSTHEEIIAAKRKMAHAPGNFSGPWLPEYPWEAGYLRSETVSSDCPDATTVQRTFVIHPR
jgi:hypothetical protein